MASRSVVALIGLADGADVALKTYLERRSYDAFTADSRWQADQLLSTTRVDVVIVDLEDRSLDPLGLLRRYGGSNTPLFILLSSGSDVIERVLALELGAADVVDRGIDIRELATRVGGLLARQGRQTPDLIVLENSTVDLRAALVMHRSGEEEALSPGQVALIRLFAANPRKVLTREDIMADAPAETTDAFDRSIDSRIVRLRRKLDTESIATIRGAGYRFDPPAVL